MAGLHTQGEEGKEEGMGHFKPLPSEVRLCRRGKSGLADPIPEEPGRTIAGEG